MMAACDRELAFEFKRRAEQLEHGPLGVSPIVRQIEKEGVAL
jgi:hypothetical protein